MSTEVDRLLVTLEARLDKYNADLNRGMQMTNTQLARMEGRFATFSSRLKASSSSAALGIGATLGGIGAYLSTGQVIKYADSWRTVERTLSAGEQVFGVRLRSINELNDLANEARVDNEAYAKLYTRTAAAVRELGVAETDVAKATSTVAMALKLGTANAGEQASVMLQLSQALQKGKLDGDEFRAVMENAGVVQELLAEKLHVSKGAIVQMAAEGKLKVETLFSALVDGNEKVARIFNGLPSTIEEGFIVLDNKVEQFIGHLNNAYGGTDAFVRALKLMSDNIEPVADGVVTLGAALLAAFSPRIIASIAAIPLSIGAAAGPLGLIAGAAGAAAVGFDLFGRNIDYSADGMTTFQDMSRATIQILTEEMGTLLAYMQAIPGGISASSSEAVSAIRGVLNVMIGAVVAAVRAVGVAIFNVPQAIGEAVINMVNALISGVQSLLDAVIDGVNNLIAGINRVPGIELEFLTAPDLGQVSNAYQGAGEAAGKAFVGAIGALTDDYFAMAGDKAGAILSGIEARAREIGAARGWAVQGVTSAVQDKPKYPGVSDEDKAAARRQKQWEKDLRQLEGKIAMEKTEADAIGRSAFEAERLRVQQELLNEARRAGVTLTSADQIKIDALSTAMARATVETKMLQDAFDDVSNTSKEMLSTFIRDLREGKSASDALSGALNRIADKLIDMAVNDLVEQALGGLTGRGGNATGAGFGSALASLFGFAEGGVFMPGAGPRQLQTFATGGVSNKAAIFGEAGPEAAVPLPDGRRIPVDLRMPAQASTAGAGGPITLVVSPTFNVQNGTPEGIAKLRGEIAAELPRLVEKTVGNVFDRKTRFARSGL